MRSKIGWPVWACMAAMVVVGGATSAQTQRVDYAEFAHRRHVGEQKLTCESCHRFPSANWKEVRKSDDAFADITEYPEHKDCLSCHRPQFFARERPAPRICKNCHVNATPNDTARLPFPSLGEKFAATAKGANFVSDFTINFPQDKHADQDVSFKKGTVMHAACFVCHNVESELAPLPQSCGSCHKLSEDRTTVAAGTRKLLMVLIPVIGAFSFVQGQTAAVDYSKFKHENPQHARLPCLLCHRRENNAARPTLPGKSGHTPCAGCHASQFNSSSGPMCNICHSNVPAGTVKAFPSLSSFNVKFDHARHAAVGASCATCHRQNRGGVAFSIPAGHNAHSVCYECHTPQAKSNGRSIGSCNTCHALGRLVRTSERAAAFSVGFSHAKHDNSDNLRCADCHRVRPGLPSRRQVTSPLALNHHAPERASSCRTCHDGKRAFGGDDFSVCSRCHTGSRWQF